MRREEKWWEKRQEDRRWKGEDERIWDKGTRDETREREDERSLLKEWELIKTNRESHILYLLTVATVHICTLTKTTCLITDWSYQLCHSVSTVTWHGLLTNPSLPLTPASRPNPFHQLQHTHHNQTEFNQRRTFLRGFYPRGLFSDLLMKWM